MTKNFETSLVIRAGVKGIEQIVRLADEIEAAGTDVEHLRQSAQNLEDSWRNLSTEEQTRRLRNLSHEALRLRNMTQARMTLGLDVDDRIRQQIRAVTQAYQQLRSSGTLSTAELNRATQAYHQRLQALEHQLEQTEHAQNQLSNSSEGAKRAFNGLKGLMTSLGVGVGLSEIIALSDEFNNLEARVRLATQAGGDFHGAMASIRDIADHTTMPLTATSELFTKLTTATKALGYTQSDVVGLTKTISEAMAVSGGSAESMNAAITQLAQGLSAGALRGDEFNSVVEQSPRLAAAMADGLGVTIGKLREMAGEGKLTAEVVGNALKSQAQIIAQEYAQMPTTVSGAITVLKNNILSVIGDIDNELQANNALATFILDIANGIEGIDTTPLINSLSNLGQIAQILSHIFEQNIQSISELIGAFTGLDGAGQNINLLKALMDGLNITTGAVADGFLALQIVATGAIAGVKTAIAELATTMHKMTGLGGEFAKSMAESAQKSRDEVQKLALDFESSLGRALENVTATTQSKLQTMADDARAKYDEMAKSGTASTEQLNTAFMDYAHKAIEANNGVANSTLQAELAQRGLQTATDATGNTIITAMQNAKQAIDGVDLSKHADSFKALNIDMSEFAGGLSTKANTALNAFNDLASLASGNADKLAMAYNGAKTAMGDNAKGLAELDNALTKVLGGSTDLAQAVKRLADEQHHAKNATSEQTKALEALGVSMEAVNAGMTKSAQEMVKNLNTGLTAIKDTAKGADELKVAINLALDTALASAKTQNDFRAIQEEIQKAGVQAAVSAENIAKINAGAAYGSEGVKQLNQRIQETAKATEQVAVSGHKATQALSDGAKHADKAWQSLNQTVKDTADNAQKASDNMQNAGKHSKEASDALVKFFNPHANIDSVIDYLKKQGLNDDEARTGASRFETKRRGLSQKILNEFASRQGLRAGEKSFNEELDEYARNIKNGDTYSSSIGGAVKEVADAWESRIKQAEMRGAENVLKQLAQEAKMRAR